MPLYGKVELPGRPDLENVARLDRLAIPLIRRCHRLGLGIDREYMWDLSLKFGREIEGLEKDIASYIPADRLNEFSDRAGEIEEEEGAISFNAASAEQIGKLLFDMLDFKALADRAGLKLATTKTGDRLTTGKKQMEVLRKLEHPIIPLVLRHRELKKLKTTYTDKLPKQARLHKRGGDCPLCGLRHNTDHWRVHGTMGTTRADTGRINHRDPNLGNVPTRTDDGQEVQAGFCAEQGHKLIIRDLSQIELRDLAHLANCLSMIQIYLDGGDIHDNTSRAVFNLAPDVKPDKIKHRMAAKRCIAKGQRVLTPKGLVAIEKITCHDLVWDGVEWVSHEGCVSNGFLPTIEHDGLRCTLDHSVWTEDGEVMYAAEAKRRGAKLAITGVEETPIRYAHDNEHRDLQDSEWVSRSGRTLFRVPEDIYDFVGQHSQGNRLLLLSEESKVSRPESLHTSGEILCDQAAVRESKESKLAQLRRQGDREQVQERGAVRSICAEEIATQGLQRSGDWTEGQRGSLRAGEHWAGDGGGESTQQTKQSLDQLQGETNRSNGFTSYVEERLSEFQSRLETHLQIGSGRSSLAADCESQRPWEIQEVEVFDLVNAGPRHRFTVEGKLVSNTGFGVMNGTTEKGLYLQLVMDYGSSKIPVPDWLTEDWCKWFIAQFLEAYPEIQEYFDRMWYRARRYGMAWDSFGRVKLLPELKSYHSWVRSSGLRQAQNMPVTSMAAGQLKLIMGKTDETLQQLYDAGVWCWPLLTIHDAVMVEVEEEYAEDVDQTLAYDFDNCMRDEQTGVELSRVPIKSDGDVIDYDETGKSRWKK